MKLTAPKSDSTRSRKIEHQIQSRVTSELERLQSTESAKFSQIIEKLSDETPPPEDLWAWRKKMLSGESEEPKKDLNHDAVSAEIASLKKKLEGRRKLEEADPGVEKAREAVIQCLRLNDRRPLDCYKEVAAFRKEVGRLEKQFVERSIR